MAKRKKRVLKVKNICIFIGILVLLGLGIYYVITMPVKNIYIKGTNIISDNEILEITSLYEYPSFLKVSKKKIEKDIKKNVYIKDVSVKKKFGNIIEITIEEYKSLFIDNDNIVIETSQRLPNTYNINDVPVLSNEILDSSIYSNLCKKLMKIEDNILRQISQIEYAKEDVDADRFLLYMNDGNLVYITLTKIDKLNKYNKIKATLENRKGTIYLDSGNYVELKQG